MSNSQALSSLFGPAHVTAQARSVIGVLNDLIELIEVENTELARGMPASLASTVTEKTRLAGALEGWVSAVKSGTVNFEGIDEALKLELAARSRLLTDLMQDNTTRILAAMDASKRRINAIMQAVRDQHGGRPSYGVTGLVTNRNDAAPGKAGGWI